MMAADHALPRRRARARRKRLALAIWSGLATAGVLLVVDGFFAGRSLVGNLTRARSELNVGIEAIVTGDPRGARPHFQAAIEAADRASGAVGHPSLGLAGLLPIAGTNLDAAAGVAAASRETALAGAAMVDVATALRWSDVGLPAAKIAGRLDLDAMRTAAPGLDEVVARLQEAVVALEETGADGLLGPVATGYRDAMELLTRRADLTARLRDTLRLLPAMFGADGSRRYLLVAPSLGVPRPSGGAPGSAGILHAEDGVTRLESLDGTEGELSPAMPALVDVAGSPDGPTYARRLLEAAAAAGVTDLDGVVWMDPVTLEDLVWAVGDVKVPGRPLALSDLTTTTALEFDSLLGTAPAAAGDLQARWIARIVEAFMARRPGVESFAMAAAIGGRDGHLGIFLRDGDAQRLVRAVGLDQAVPRPREGVLPLLATWSSTGDNHVGALVSTRIRHDVTILSDGSVRARTEVTFDNRAGVEPPSALLGRIGGLVPIGTFAADVGVLIPAESRQVAAETSIPSPISIDQELGYESVRGSVSVRSETAATLTVSYLVRDAVVTTDEGSSLVLRLLPQPTLEGISYSIRIGVSEGAVISSPSSQLRPRGGALTFGGVQTGPVDLELAVG
jgi:hypothetical protein